MHSPAVVTTLLVAAATSLGAQSAALGGVDGTLRERIATRSVRATVSLVQLGSAASASRSARPDGQGRFRVDSLPAGKYLMQISTPTLDSLDLAMPPREVRIDGGRMVRADAELPFGAELRDLVCHSGRLGEATVAVAGRVLDADTDKPLEGAQVVATWTDVIADGLSRAKTQKRSVVAKTGALGEYRLCGIPGGTTLALRLQYADRGGPSVRLTISPDEGAVVRDLSISTRSAPSLALLDSMARLAADPSRAAAPVAPLQLTGTATVTGIVRGVGAMPLAGVEVRVRYARPTTATDSSGKFVLGGLPAGTQIMQLMRDGYPLTEVVVELRPDRSTEQSVLMVRTTKPDSASQSTATLYREFEAHRRAYAFGQFLDVDEVTQKAKAITETVDLFADMLGFTALGHGADARLISNEALAAQPDCKSAKVVAEGVDGFAINDIPPGQVGAIEAYSNSQFVPERYAGKAACGLVVIWMRKETPGRKGSGPTLRGNGYP